MAGLAADVEWVRLRGGEILFHADDPGDSLYIVAWGRLHAIAGEEVLREIGRGDNVGELSILTEEKRSATVRAVRDTELIRLTTETFEHFLAEHPETAQSLVRMLAAWVRHSTVPSPRRSEVRTIALVPLTEALPSSHIAVALQKTLECTGCVEHVSRARLDRECHPGASEETPEDPGYARAAAWFDHLEEESRFLIYEADLDAPTWLQRCLRQADRVVLLCDADDAPQPAVERLRQLAQGIVLVEPHLVLVQRDSCAQPHGTARWLDAFHPRAHHHVRMGQRSDVDRLARRLMGISTGVVLSGGGARGFAHIGVLRALQEGGFPIDRVGGTSMGAVIAAQLACGLSPEEMLERNRLWARENPLRDLTLPILALVSGQRGSRLIRQMFGTRRYEDLWIDCFSTATNLTHARLEVVQRGPLADALRAAISIPGIAPPVPQPNGDLLADGGVLDNLPVDAMRQNESGTVIAIDVAPAEEMSMPHTITQPPTAWEAALSRLGVSSEARAFPSIFRILERSALVASVAQTQRARASADVYLAPPVAAFPMFGWEQLRELADAGLEYARELLRSETPRG